MAPRPSTPVNVASSSHSITAGSASGGGGGDRSNNNSNTMPQFIHTHSAPNSPARGYHNHNNDNNHNNSNNNSILMLRPSFPEVLRLPSQDSVNRSIHNDSGGGGVGTHKTAQQIIRDLQQSNARLTARTAALETDFMNQLNKSTRHFEVLYSQLEEVYQETPLKLQKVELRRQVEVQKLHEKDEWLDSLKEESSFHWHTISDLKLQLKQFATARRRDSSCIVQIQTTIRRIGIGLGSPTFFYQFIIGAPTADHGRPRILPHKLLSLVRTIGQLRSFCVCLTGKFASSSSTKT
ncbi:hypothetical protein ACA910_012216 [Epithemia clementina (nom. ined.)]